MPYKHKADKNKNASAYYRENMREIIEKVQLCRKRRKHDLIAYKGGACFDCGGVFPDVCFDFDHRDVGTKSFEISKRMGHSLGKLFAEADKCDLVCANCHRIRTATNPDISSKIKSRMKKGGWYAPTAK